MLSLLLMIKCAAKNVMSKSAIDVGERLVGNYGALDLTLLKFGIKVLSF